MNQVLLCAICLSNRLLAEAQATANGSTSLGELPAVSRAHTMFGGTAVCRDHIIARPAQPGDAARQAGLIV